MIHDFDLVTQFCNRCGCSVAELVGCGRECHDGENIRSIVPVLAMRRLARLLGLPAA